MPANVEIKARLAKGETPEVVLLSRPGAAFPLALSATRATDVTVDVSLAAHFEHTIAVTDDVVKPAALTDSVGYVPAGRFANVQVADTEPVPALAYNSSLL